MVEAPLQDPERRHEPKQLSKYRSASQGDGLAIRQQRTFESGLNVALKKPREMQCNAR
jgi:hypothetical protein